MLDAAYTPIVCVGVRTFPLPDTVPGGLAYEPKFDGLRAGLIKADDGNVRLLSRHHTRLDRWFPEIAAAGEQLPAGTLLDGELVLWRHHDGIDALDFATLCRRMGTSAAHARTLARTAPAMFIAFDVLYLAGHDHRKDPYTGRRALLEQLQLAAPLTLCPSTQDPAVAAVWFDELAVTGVEGIVAKKKTSRYTTRGTSWLKLRSVTTTEMALAGVVGTLARPRQLLLALPYHDRLRLTAITSTLNTAQQHDLTPLLQPALDEDSPWPVPLPATWYPGPPGIRDTDLPYQPVQPIVVEVAADVAVDKGRYRHPLSYLRARPDLTVADLPHPAR